MSNNKVHMVRAGLVLTIVSCAFGVAAAGTDIACTAEQAFGFPFGKPVPSGATDVKEKLFQGGFAGGNVLASFNAPAPVAKFTHYAYWSNRDRQSVYSVQAYTALISDAELAGDESARVAALEIGRAEITQLRDEWQELYGFVYQRVNESGLKWRAEKDGVVSTIGVMGAQYLYIDCTHTALENQAIAKALK